MEWTEAGLKITLGSNGRFIVDVGDRSLGFETLDLARKAANSQAKLQALEAINKLVLLPDGTEAILEGVHGNTGNWKFKADGKALFVEYEDRAPTIVYYPQDAARDLLQQKHQMEARIAVMDTNLARYKLELRNLGGGGLGRPQADEIVRRHDAVTERYAEIEASIEGE